MPSNLFALFGLPIQFDVEMTALDQRYLAAQAAVHPDLFVERSDMEKRIAAQQAVTLNEAYRRLKNPLTRAEEFLKARNVSVPGEGGATIPASALLAQVLEWREKIQSGDLLLALKEELNQRLEKNIQSFDEASDEQLPYCYLDLIYTQKTLNELEIVLKK